MSINKVILVGNVGKDPVVRYFDKGSAKATFPLATSETYTNQQGETITSTEWHNIVLWRALAEVAEKTIKKGSQVYIVGKIKTRSYVDKDGVNKYITEILADAMLLLDKKQPAGQYTNQTRDAQGKNPSVSSVNENQGSYNTPSGIPDDESIIPDNSQNEDDLPF
ncbi:MAG TPA: single-stranded DNA-binding protein [Bacteroidales bacterium]|nr:single-stranded DNA-binding protein [Bacteroidales bacterium]